MTGSRAFQTTADARPPPVCVVAVPTALREQISRPCASACSKSSSEIAYRQDPSSAQPTTWMAGLPAQDGVANLVGKAFFAHYEPRLRDNERALQVQPLRGGLLDTRASNGR
jgi:hypothetical protein